MTDHLKLYSVEYNYGGKLRDIEVRATSFEDAKSHLWAAAAGGEAFEIVEQIPVSDEEMRRMGFGDVT